MPKALCWLVSALAVVTLACGGGRITIPPLETKPTPTVPASYVSFTDPVGLFSISYPREWKVEFSSLNIPRKDATNIVETILASKRSGSYLGGAVILFATLPSSGRDYSASINIHASSASKEPLDKQMEDELNQIAKFQDRRIHKVAKIPIDGRESIFRDVEEGFPNLRYIEVDVPDSNILWTLYCYIWSPPFKENTLKTCESVLRTFRILQ